MIGTSALRIPLTLVLLYQMTRQRYRLSSLMYGFVKPDGTTRLVRICYDLSTDCRMYTRNDLAENAELGNSDIGT